MLASYAKDLIAIYLNVENHASGAWSESNGFAG